MIRNLLITIILTLFCCTLLYVMVGDDLHFGAPPMTEIDDYYITKGQEQTGANNIVTAVVFDYRGFDTLGEATVLFITVLGIGMLATKAMSKDEEDSV